MISTHHALTGLTQPEYEALVRLIGWKVDVEQHQTHAIVLGGDDPKKTRVACGTTVRLGKYTWSTLPTSAKTCVYCAAILTRAGVTNWR